MTSPPQSLLSSYETIWHFSCNHFPCDWYLFLGSLGLYNYAVAYQSFLDDPYLIKLLKWPNNFYFYNFFYINQISKYNEVPSTINWPSFNLSVHAHTCIYPYPCTHFSRDLKSVNKRKETIVTNQQDDKYQFLTTIQWIWLSKPSDAALLLCISNFMQQQCRVRTLQDRGVKKNTS